eukprot:SAG11_NODE_32673_length_281_cov_2.153846_1_plen_31_part_01
MKIWLRLCGYCFSAVLSVPDTGIGQLTDTIG